MFSSTTQSRWEFRVHPGVSGQVESSGTELTIVPSSFWLLSQCKSWDGLLKPLEAIYFTNSLHMFPKDPVIN